MSPALDHGLQPERTQLAWRRTALSLTAGGLVGLRILPPAAGPLGLAAAALAVVGGGLLWHFGARRAHRVAVALTGANLSPPAGGLLLGLALVVATCALLLAVGTALRHV